MQIQMKSEIQTKAEVLAAQGIFLGGPVRHFDAVGRFTLTTLLALGLSPNHNLLDVGCGCLRIGYWLIHLLDQGRYAGLEPNTKMLQTGLDVFLSAETVESKRPKFASNDDFDFSVFDVSFDFVLARSIWTHAAPRQIETMLDGFVHCSNPRGLFLTSYLPAIHDEDHYRGAEWVGRSHNSNEGGVVRYKFDWIRDLCAAHDLLVRELDNKLLKQTWLVIGRRP
jgi:SAM-dependent methyltransferase